MTTRNTPPRPPAPLTEGFTPYHQRRIAEAQADLDRLVAAHRWEGFVNGETLDQAFKREAARLAAVRRLNQAIERAQNELDARIEGERWMTEGWGAHRIPGSYSWHGSAGGCDGNPCRLAEDTPQPPPEEAAPALTKTGKIRDSQRSKLYEFERNAREMAGGSRYTRRAQGCGRDKTGSAHRSYKTDSEVWGWDRVHALIEKVCARFQVPKIRPIDGGNRMVSASFRWEPTSKRPHHWPRLKHANGRTYTVLISLPRWARQEWAVLHELAHYLTYCFYPPSTPSHGPEFVGLYLRLLEEFGPQGFDRTAAEEEATRRRVKFVPQDQVDNHLELAVEAGLSKAFDPVEQENRQKAAIEDRYRREAQEREQARKDWEKDFGHLLDRRVDADQPCPRVGIAGGGIDLSGLEQAWNPQPPADWWGRFQAAQGPADGGNGPLEGERLPTITPPWAAALTRAVFAGWPWTDRTPGRGSTLTPPVGGEVDHARCEGDYALHLHRCLTPAEREAHLRRLDRIDRLEDADSAGWPCEFCGQFDECLRSCPSPTWPPPEESPPGLTPIEFELSQAGRIIAACEEEYARRAMAADDRRQEEEAAEQEALEGQEPADRYTPDYQPQFDAASDLADHSPPGPQPQEGRQAAAEAVALERGWRLDTVESGPRGERRSYWLHPNGGVNVITDRGITVPSPGRTRRRREEAALREEASPGPQPGMRWSGPSNFEQVGGDWLDGLVDPEEVNAERDRLLADRGLRWEDIPGEDESPPGPQDTPAGGPGFLIRDQRGRALAGRCPRVDPADFWLDTDGQMLPWCRWHLNFHRRTPLTASNECAFCGVEPWTACQCEQGTHLRKVVETIRRRNTPPDTVDCGEEVIEVFAFGRKQPAGERHPGGQEGTETI